jgi:hypothetical protein
MAKYEFTGETKIEFGIKFNRIRAVVAIAALGIAAGDLGGWVEKESKEDFMKLKKVAEAESRTLRCIMDSQVMQAGAEIVVKSVRIFPAT